MRKSFLNFKTLLTAAVLCVGSMSALADEVASYNFDSQTTPFTIADASRLNTSYALLTGSETDRYVKYSCGNMNGVAFAYYNFSSSVSDAATVTVEFDFNITQVAGHALISIADASAHTASGGGFSAKSNTGYGSTGAIFNLGCFRASNNNKFAINSTQTNYEGLDAWCHASVVVDNAAKKVSYLITKSGEELASATDIAFLNASANRCSQVDLYIGTNATGNAIQIDNLTITKTVSDMSHNYTINAMVGSTKLKQLASGIAKENAGYSVSVPKVILYEGNYYVLNNGQTNMNQCLAEYTMGTNDETKEIYYTLDESIIFFKEAEDIQQSYALSTASNGYACGYYATPQTINITEEGVYQLETNVTGRDSNSSLDLYTPEGTTAVASFAKNIGTGVKTLYFVANGDMRVGGPYYDDKFNNSKSVDYILVRKVAEVTDANNEIIGTFDYTETTYPENKSSNITLKAGETKVITFQNHGKTNGANWDNWKIYVTQAETVKSITRADSWDEIKNAGVTSGYRYSDDGGTTTLSIDNDEKWADFRSYMGNANVVATLSYGTDGTLSITTTSTNGTRTYYVDNTVSELGTDNLTINIFPTWSWIEMLSVETTVVSATITDAGWATLYTPYALDFSGVAGLEAYTATCSENTVTLTKVNNVPANTGVVLKGTEGSYKIPVIASSSTARGDLAGNAEAETAFDAVAGKTLYVLTKDGVNAQFNPVTSGEIAAGKAYLPVTAGGTSKLRVVIEGETTGIAALEAADAVESGVMYNLAGQQVNAAYKGIVIKNGKKFIIK